MLLKRRTNNTKMHLIVGVAGSTLILLTSSLSAQGASSIAQGFKTDDANVVSGALVSLKSGTANTVELGTSANTDRLLGIAGEDSLIELSSGTGTVQIVTNGETRALVSDINGQVKTGDKITTSPISGVGMKALTSTLVIGTAQADLDSVKPETRVIKDKDGKEKSVRIGAISIQVDKVFYEAPQDANSFVPPVLQDFAASLAGHQVSPIRIIIAAFLAFALFAVVAVLLYSAVRSSIISIGRNPLSESAVRSGLIQVGLTVLGVSAFTIIVIYLILTT